MKRKTDNPVFIPSIGWDNVNNKPVFAVQNQDLKKYADLIPTNEKEREDFFKHYHQALDTFKTICQRNPEMIPAFREALGRSRMITIGADPETGERDRALYDLIRLDTDALCKAYQVGEFPSDESDDA